MEENLAQHRQSYERSALNRENLSENPMQLFKIWFEEAEKAETELENNAMTLSTIDENGCPKNRIVLLKRYNDQGFVFFTNYTSEKSKSILQNPKVSLSFFWPRLERQVIVKGTAQKISLEDSEQYFSTRPRGSQIGAWVSHQSAVISSRETLENRQQDLEEQFAGKAVPRPEFWGGFIVHPGTVEFWQGRPNRLHDRFKYYREQKDWKTVRLAP